MARVRVRILDTRLELEFVPGGDAYAEAKSVAREVKAEAVLTAPGRSGNLKAQHKITDTGQRPLHTIVDVRNDADYSGYVHDGTTGPIYPNGNVLKMRPAPHSYFPTVTFHHEVRGQGGQPWLSNAATTVFRRRYGAGF